MKPIAASQQLSLSTDCNKVFWSVVKLNSDIKLMK